MHNRQTLKQYQIDLTKLSDDDQRLLFVFFMQQPSANYFTKSSDYAALVEGKAVYITLSHDVSKKFREHKPGKTIPSGEYRYEILGKQLGMPGSMGFFRACIGTMMLDQSLQRVSVKFKETRGVKFTKGLNKQTGTKSYIMTNGGKQVLAVDHAYNMMRLNKDIYRPKKGMYDDATQHYLLPMHRFHGEDFFEYLLDGSCPASHLAKLSLEGRLKICENMLLFLQKLHNNHFIHRDLKPENMLINLATLEVYIIDTDLGLDSSLSTEGACSAGSYNYVSPEMWDEKRVTEATDIFSIGRVLMMILGNVLKTGRYYFEVPPAYCGNSNRFYADVTRNGKVIAKDLLFDALPYQVDDETKKLMYQFLHSTQAVNPHERPTIQGCLDQLKAITESNKPVATSTPQDAASAAAIPAQSSGNRC